MKNPSCLLFALLVYCVTAQAYNPVENLIFSAKDLDESLTQSSGKFCLGSVEFKDDWRVIEYKRDGTILREGLYVIGDDSLWDEEGLVIEVMFRNGTSSQYILSPESDWLSVSFDYYLQRSK